jgi:hypothetical protein
MEEAVTLRASAFALVALLLVQGTIEGEKSGFDYQSDLGIAVDLSGRTCLDIRNDAMSEGEKIRFVNTDTPPTTGEAEIVRKLDETCIPSDQKISGLSHYELKVVRGTLTKSAPAFAIASFAGELTVKDASVYGDLDGDHRVAAFRSCTSQEGVHLTVWKGRPLRGVRKWHFYYYLGYDVEPSCTMSDTKPGNR